MIYKRRLHFGADKTLLVAKDAKANKFGLVRNVEIRNKSVRYHNSPTALLEWLVGMNPRHSL